MRLLLALMLVCCAYGLARAALYRVRDPENWWKPGHWDREPALVLPFFVPALLGRRIHGDHERAPTRWAVRSEALVELLLALFALVGAILIALGPALVS